MYEENVSCAGFPRTDVNATSGRTLASATAVTLMLALVLTVSACAVGPDFQAPAAPDVQALTRRPITDVPLSPQGEAVSAQWWDVYRSDRINQLVQLALSRNPTVEAGLANLRAAQELVTAQRGAFFPSVQIGYSAARQNAGSVISTPLAAGDTVFNLRTAQLNVGFVPDVFGGNRRQVESLQAGANSQQFQLAALKVTLASNVVAAVIQEQQLLDQMVIAQTAVKVAAEQLQLVKGLLAAGYSSTLDVAQQQVAYSQTQALLPPLQKQLEQTRNLLAILCGQMPSLDLPASAVAEIEAPNALPRIVPARLVAYRPDIQAAQELLRASYAQIGVATANMYPQINISAGASYNSNALASLLSSDSRAWGLIAGLTQPLFAGGALRARKRSAEATAEAAMAQYQSVVQTAFQNVADTLYALESDSQSLRAAKELETASQALYDQSSRQFLLGYLSRPLLLAAQQTLLQAQLARISANALYLGDTVALYQSLGGGWQKPPANDLVGR